MPSAPLALGEVRVDADFRTELQKACDRTGATPAEFALEAAFERLRSRGVPVSRVWPNRRAAA